MKRIFLVVGLLIALFLVSACAPQVSDEQLFLQLENLSDEELDAALAEDNAALAGKALAYKFSKESSNKVSAVQQQLKPLAWLSCSVRDAVVEVKYSYDGIKSRTFTSSCSGDQLQEYSCSGNTYVRKTRACENGCFDEKCLISSSKFTPVKTGLVAWWDGDDVTGTVAKDLISNNNGVLINGATTAVGKIGNAFKFDGFDASLNDDHILVSPFSSTLSEFTVNAWINADVGSLGLYHDRVILSQDGPISWKLFVQSSAISGVHNLFFKYDDGTINRRMQFKPPLGAPAIVENLWRHVALTVSFPTGAVKAYVDGVEYTLDNQASEPSTPTDLLFPTVKIGSSVDVGLGVLELKPWDGHIDEIQLYNRILSQAEIQSIYNYQPLKPDIIKAVIQN